MQFLFLLVYQNIHILLPGLVAEVTQPSLGVGYEIGRAVAMDKKILCLYRPQEGKSKYYHIDLIHYTGKSHYHFFSLLGTAY